MRRSIGELRSILGLSQADLASVLGASRHTLMRWESHDSAPKMAILACLALYHNLHKTL